MKMKKNRVLTRIALMCIVSFLCMNTMKSATAEKVEQKSLSVLAIGNSFSDDALQYLYQIAADCGVEKIVVANLYIGGCTLATHWKNASNNNASYSYRENSSGSWKTENNYSMEQGIARHKWDIISLQQASGSSGMADTYNSDLTNLIDYVKRQPNAENAKLVWHMTWAYQGDSSHGEFSKYNKDQMTMYNAICNAVQEKVLPTGAFSMVIPSGTAIQNLRTSFLGDTLTRDGYHLTYDIGRYTAGLTWAKALDLPLEAVHTLPSGVPAEYLRVLREAVENAWSAPYQVTRSSYAVREDLYDLSDYVELKWDYTCSAYWNSSLSGTLFTHSNSSEPDLNRFVASTHRFTREELPVGSLLVVDSGYQYRPDGWLSGSPRNSLRVRPAKTSKTYVIIDEHWWGNFETRAFNVSATGTNSIFNAAEAASHFHIYIPKEQTES